MRCHRVSIYDYMINGICDTPNLMLRLGCPAKLQADDDSAGVLSANFSTTFIAHVLR